MTAMNHIDMFPPYINQFLPTSVNVPTDLCLYVVLNENTLGYRFQTESSTPGESNLAWFGVLHGNIVKGGRDWRDGPYLPGSLDQLRPATKEDFDTFRVSFAGHGG